jgi:ATP-dependent exoDNAse (exonuclease V) alpha subunit
MPDGSVLGLARNQALSLDYSYAVTGHSAQGLDASRVVLEKNTYSRTTNRRSFYTDVTRARDVAIVATNSKTRLVQVVRSDDKKVAALEVIGSPKTVTAYDREASAGLP